VYIKPSVGAAEGCDLLLLGCSQPTHQLVTERPSVAQNHAHVTKPRLPKSSPRKISSTPEPLIQALSSLASDFSQTILQQVGRLIAYACMYK
jgi:hypothetical protein